MRRNDLIVTYMFASLYCAVLCYESDFQPRPLHRSTQLNGQKANGKQKPVGNNFLYIRYRRMRVCEHMLLNVRKIKQNKETTSKRKRESLL
jgi:hypothetical protein